MDVELSTRFSNPRPAYATAATRDPTHPLAFALRRGWQRAVTPLARADDKLCVFHGKAVNA